MALQAGRSSKYQVNFLTISKLSWKTEELILRADAKDRCERFHRQSPNRMKKHNLCLSIQWSSQWTSQPSHRKHEEWTTNEPTVSALRQQWRAFATWTTSWVPASFWPANQQQRGRSCYWILSKIYSRTRRQWHQQRHRSKLVACPIGRAQPCKANNKKGTGPKRQPQTAKTTANWFAEASCMDKKGLGHSMTTGNYCIYGMNSSFPVSHPARLHLTTEIARWSNMAFPWPPK